MNTEVTTWKTRDGREIALREMADSHLQNTVRFLRRRGWVHTCELASMWAYSRDAGEFAALAVEQEADRARISKHADAVFDELKRRGLQELRA